MKSGERTLVAQHSGFNLLVVTENDAGLRTLRFGHDGVCQSIVKVGDPQHTALPYAGALPLCLGFVRDPTRALIVGLGGGTLPNFFHSRLPELAVDVVEIDPGVVEIAKGYCGFQEDPRLRVFIEDGRDFIENCRDRFDLIVLDCFDADSVPVHMRTLEFLGAVKKVLSPEGIVVANIWGPNSNRHYHDMLLTYRTAFEDLYVLDVPGPDTKIFIGLSSKQAISREQLIRRAREVSRRYGFRHDLSANLAGFRHADTEHSHGGMVLRD